MDVSIIIVNYFTADILIDTVNSVFEKSNGFSYEVIVVDNSNNGEEIAKIRTGLPKNCLIIDSGKNLGFGKANNLGAKHASGKYLFFLNSDTLLINNAVFSLYDFLENNPSVGIVGSNLFTIDNKPNHSYFYREKNIKNEKKNISFFSSFRRAILKKRDDFNYSNYPKRINGYVCGASLMIRKNAFNLLCGFDDRIFMYAEEALLCQMVQNQLGLEIYNIPSSKIIHLEGASFSNKVSDQKARFIVDGNYIYYLVAFGRKDAFSYLKCMKRKYLVRMVVFRILKNNKYLYYKTLFDAFEKKIENLAYDNSQLF